MTQRATIRTETTDETRANVIARALKPDNTDEMMTTADENTIETTIERPTTGGLRTTVDDYVTNLTVAAQCTNNTQPNHE